MKTAFSILALLALLTIAGGVFYAFLTENMALQAINAVAAIALSLFTIGKPALDHLAKSLPASRAEKRAERLQKLEGASRGLGNEVTNDLMGFEIIKEMSDRIYGNTAYDLLYDRHVGEWEKFIPERLPVEIGGKGHERWNSETDLVIALDSAAEKLKRIEDYLKEHKAASSSTEFYDAEMTRHCLALKRLRAKRYL